MKNEILSLLPPGHPWGQSVHYLESVDSTNNYAKILAKNGAPEGTVVVAAQQTDGRGRLGRSFSSPAGLGLYFSLILRPNCRPEQLMHLTCAAGVAAAEAVEKAFGFAPKIKWTNDLVVGKQKLGGILTELSVDAQGMVDYAIIGIGINCRHRAADFPAEIRELACSAAMVTGKDCSPALLAARLVQTLCAVQNQSKEEIMAAFRASCITVGQEICLLRGDSVRHGTALDIDDDGGLIVEFADGSVETVTSGEISIRGMYGYV